MAGSESQLKKMVSKVRLRRALLSAHTHHSPPRRQGLPAQPNEPPQAGSKPRASPGRLCRRPRQDACRPGPESLGRSRRGAATVNNGAEPRPPATCRPPSSFRGERVWSGLWGSIVFINTRRGLYLKLGLGHPRPSCPSAGLFILYSPFPPGFLRWCPFQFVFFTQLNSPPRGKS